MAKADLRSERLEKRRALEALGVDPYGGRFATTHTLQGVHALLQEAAAGTPEDVEGRPVRVAGRIVAVRDMGKSIWLDLRDRTAAKLQVNVMKKRTPESFAQFKHIDIGDILGVEGQALFSRKGEPTVFAEGFQLLCKGLEPLPEKWHGLKQVEMRYRRRYLDLISNRESLETFVDRSRIISFIRHYLDERDFLEVETPMMQPQYGGASARPFTTHLNALDLDLYLRISPECYLKRLLVGGLDRVYEINRSFRNEGVDATHNPEFTMIEIYQAYADYEVMMALTESMVSACAERLDAERQARAGTPGPGSTAVTWGEGEAAVQIDFAPPWRRLPFKEGLRGQGVDPDDEAACRERLVAVLAAERERHEGSESGDTARLAEQVGRLDHDHVLAELFGELVEPTLVQPTFVTHLPTGLTPLCRPNRDDPTVHDRFEVICCGMEIANAYSEQNDPLAQREAFAAQLTQRDSDGATYGDALDEDFCTALEVGMPPAGGLGIGIDRLIMLLTNRQNVREVILFPTLKPRAAVADEADEAAATVDMEGE